MNNTNDTPPQEIDPELEAALQMPDSEYIKHLEEYIVHLTETSLYAKQALETFVELLEFIKENFGETLDYPVRIDSDFYKDVFVEKLQNCQTKVEEFVSSFKDSGVKLEDDDVF